MNDEPDSPPEDQNSLEPISVEKYAFTVKDVTVIILVIVFVAVVVVVVLALLGPAIGNIFSNIVQGI